MNSKKILIVTYYWPPSAGVGVQRWLHFALNLKKMGWEPIVFTPENPQFELIDQDLLTSVKGIETLRHPIWEPFNLFHKITGNKDKGQVKQGLVLEKKNRSLKDQLAIWVRGNLLVPDPRRFWVKSAVKEVVEVVKSRDIRHLVTTGPPHSVHLIGRGVKRKLQEVRWLADFRDPWSDWDVLPKLKTSKLVMSMHQNLEKTVLREADHIVTVSPRLALALGEKVDRKVNLVYNGVEIARHRKKPIKDPSKYVVGYFGLLNELRDPDVLWQVLSELCAQDSDMADRLILRLGGIVSDSILEKLMEDPFLSKRMDYVGYLSHEEVFQEYAKCDLLVLLLNKTDNAKWILPQKFFEYLTTGNPILSIGACDSDLGDLFSKYDVGKHLEDTNREEIASFILSTFAGKSNLNLKDIDQLLNSFSREAQTRKLIKVLNE